MNIEWVLKRLNEYVELVDDYVATDGKSYSKDKSERFLDLVRIAQATLHTIDYPRHYVDEGPWTAYGLKGRHQVAQALAYFRTAEEIQNNLEELAPRMQADQLHKWIWLPAKSLWETGHFREAVQASATNVNAHLQRKAGRRDVSDYKLTTELFSEKDPEPGRPRLRWPADPTSEEFKSMQAGLRSFAAGAFQCIRNRATHDMTELTEQQAFERLSALSLLCHWIETCSLVESHNPSPSSSSAN